MPAPNDGVLGPQLERLLRMRWTGDNVNVFAEEVYTVLGLLEAQISSQSQASDSGDTAKKTAVPAKTIIGGIPCQIQSGSSDTYMADVYEKGLQSKPVSVQVKQLQIAKTEIIPAKTWTFAAKMPDGTYLIQVPIWL